MSAPGPVAPITFDTAAVTAQLQRSVSPFSTGTPYSFTGMLSSIAAKTGTVPGTTYVWDPDSLAYVASSLTGAPGNAVRFILYTLTLFPTRPVVPLQPFGYFDAIIQNTGATRVAELSVVRTTGPTPVTYWHATVTRVSGASWITNTVVGSFTNGTNGMDLTSADSTIAPGVSGTNSALLIDPATNARLRLQKTTGSGSAPYTLRTSYAYSIALSSDSLNGTGSVDLTLPPGGTPTTSASLTVEINGGLFSVLGYDSIGRLRGTDPRGQPFSPAVEALVDALFESPDAVWTGVQYARVAASAVH